MALCVSMAHISLTSLLHVLFIYRFSTILSRDKDSMPRTWTANEDIRAITREARLAVLIFHISSIIIWVPLLYFHSCVKPSSVIYVYKKHNLFTIFKFQALRLMSVMAALRFDDKQDKIDRALMISLLDGGQLSEKRSIEFTSDPLASSTWQEVLPLMLGSLLWF
jgi:hypothetical protein